MTKLDVHKNKTNGMRGIKRHSDYLLALIAAVSFTSANVENSISLSLNNPNDKGMDVSWIEANKLGPILNQPAKSSGSDAAYYWSGASTYQLLTPDDATMIQIMFDILMANPLEHYSTDTRKNPLIDKIYQQVTGTPITPNAREYILKSLEKYSGVQETPQSIVYRIFHDLHTLEIQAMSCNAFWETSNQMGRTVPKVVVLDENDDAIPQNISSCQKAICTTRNPEPFNAFYEISDKAGTLHKALSSLNCERVFQNSPLEQSLCTRAKKMLNFDKAGTSDRATIKIADGHKYIRALPVDIEAITKVLQPLLLLQLSKEAAKARSNNSNYAKYQPITFKSLSSPTSPHTSSTRNIDGKLHASAPIAPLTPLIDKMIDEMFGLNGDFSALTPGLSIGLDDQENFTALVAGKFIEFKAITTKLGTPPTILRSDMADGHKKLFITKGTEEDIKTFRQSGISQFHKKRNSIRTKVVQQLLAKSASADITTMVKEQNHSTIRYTSPSGKVEDRLSHQTLKESSTWRMDANSGWLSAISAMSNVSLRREILILLAEIKQLQYFIFMNGIQQTILALFNNTVSTEGHNEFLDLLDDDAYQSISGIPKSRPSSGKIAANQINSALGDPFD